MRALDTLSQSRRPEFFIVGGVRSGTTALARYLAEHPGIFIPDVYEPSHFARDIWPEGPYADRSRYLQLFADCGDAALVLGEKSTAYSISPGALDAIMEFNPAAKIIVMVREPIAMAASFHARNLLVGLEDVEDFEQAWQLQDPRMAGRLPLPPSCPNAYPLMYGRVCQMGAFLAGLRMRSSVSAAQVQVIDHERFVAATGKVYRESLEFLGVHDDGRQVFPRINASRRLRSRRLDRCLGPAESTGGAILGRIRPGLGQRWRRAVGRVRAGNAHEFAPQSLRPEFRAQLEAYFADDLQLLAETRQGWH